MALRIPAGLTKREEEILRCLVLGLSNKEIARRLGISVPTVKFHVHHLLGKTGCESRVALVSLVTGATPATRVLGEQRASVERSRQLIKQSRALIEKAKGAIPKDR